MNEQGNGDVEAINARPRIEVLVALAMICIRRFSNGSGKRERLCWY
jgi:hypothetical protein